MARILAQGQDGYQQLPESTQEAHLRLPDAPFVMLQLKQLRDKSDSNICVAAKIAQHLRVGQIAVIDGCDYPNLPWSLETFAHLSGGIKRDGEYSLEKVIEWQCMSRQVLPEPRPVAHTRFYSCYEAH